MREYSLNLKRFGISRERSRYLSSYCQLYNERKSKLRDLYFLSSPPFDGSVVGGKISNPTVVKAVQAQNLKQANLLIDICIREACGSNPDMMKQLHSNVVDGIPYERLGWMPCSRNTFFKIRGVFFKLLDERLL